MPVKEDQERLITGSAILSYHICELQSWLILRRFAPEQDNSFISIGRFIHETSYKDKGEKEIELPGAKIDVIWKEGTVTIVGEIKKSSRSVKGARLQLLFYLKLLKERGIIAEGKILIPKERENIKVELNQDSENQLGELIETLIKLAEQETPPEAKWKGPCAKCGFADFCWA